MFLDCSILRRSRQGPHRFAGTLLLFALVAFPLRADEATPPAADDPSTPREIRDNSFFIEEAFNQEEGVVQHINTWSRDSRSGDWAYTLTQEWPAPELTHQLSYTIPVISQPGSTRRASLGDIVVNYRYQLLGGEDTSPLSIAPRLSAVLPTGDDEKGSGTGGWGAQLMLPVSWEASDRFALHGNLGANMTFRAKAPDGGRDDLKQLVAGASIVVFTGHNANVHVEALWTRSEEFDDAGSRRWTNETIVSPGIRWAFDFASGLQVVPGLAFPIGVGGSYGEKGILLYLSFEHPFSRK